MYNSIYPMITPSNKITTSNEVKYLLQLLLPILILAIWKKSFILSILAVVILFSLPFKKVRRDLISRWIELGKRISKIVSPLILAIAFYLILFPFAMIRNLIKKIRGVPLNIQNDTNWIEIPDSEIDFDKPW